MKRLLSALLVTVLCATIFVGYGGGVAESGGQTSRVKIRPSVDRVLSGVVKLNAEYSVDSARMAFAQAIKRDSSYAPAYYQMSKLLLSSYSVDSALYYAKCAYQLDTTNVWYLRNYAQVTLSKGDYVESKTLYKYLLERQPRDINAIRIMALLLQQESKHNEAIALLDSAELRVGQNPFLQSIKRQLYIGTNQTYRAIEELNVAIENAPYDPSNYIALGDIYGQIGADSLAEKNFMTAYMIDSLAPESLVSLANFYQRRGDRVSYLNYLEKIINSVEFELDVKLSLIRELAKSVVSGRYDMERAEVIFRLLADQYPRSDEAMMIYLRHLYAQGKEGMVVPELSSRIDRGGATLNGYKLLINMLSQSRAIDSVRLYIDRALREYPKENSLHFDWIYTLSREQMYEQSIEYIKQQIEVMPDSLKVDLYGLLADQHERLSRLSIEGESVKESVKRYRSNIKETYKIYRRIIKYVPDNVMVKNNFAYTLSVHDGDLKLAEQLARAVMESDGENAVYIDTHGWILFKLGRLEEAKVELRRALTLDKSNNYEILLHFAEVLFALDDDVMGDYYLDKARESGATEEEIVQVKSRYADEE
ncbi:MAG: hypothetical protein SNG35_06530 [Rikenellaceae bacterium]